MRQIGRTNQQIGGRRLIKLILFQFACSVPTYLRKIWCTLATAYCFCNFRPPTCVSSSWVSRRLDIYCQCITTDLFLRFFGFEVINDDTSVLQYFQENIYLFQENLRKECYGNCTLPAGVNVNVYISVRSPYIALKWHTNESYSLNVINRGIIYFFVFLIPNLRYIYLCSTPRIVTCVIL